MEGTTSFDCPINMTPMVDPVMAADGHSYERTAIDALNALLLLVRGHANNKREFKVQMRSPFRLSAWLGTAVQRGTVSTILFLFFWHSVFCETR
jgi:hypothetical protein